jgi:hypothetical protein
MTVEHVAWDYTTFLNIAFIVLVAVLVWWGNRDVPGDHAHSHHH